MSEIITPRFACVTIAPMRWSRKKIILAALAGMVVLGFGLYWLPPIHNRLAWQLDVAQTYLRGVIDPVSPLPTALPRPRVRTEASPENQSEPISASSFGTAPNPPAPTTQVPIQPSAGPSPTPTPSPTPIPVAFSLASPVWEKQDANNCGPTSLAMYLRFFGWEGDQFTISELLKPKREDRNVNVEELVYYVRTRAGWLNVLYRVGGDLEILKKFIAAGLPVMIEEGTLLDATYWPNDDRWAAHYLLLTAYDDENGIFTGQDSYYGADQRISYQKLDQQWIAFNRVYIILYPPQKEDTVRSILGPHQDEQYNRQHALQVAQSEAETNPENAFAWFNLGTNQVYFEQYLDATDSYDVARQLGLPQRMLRYQFGPFMAYFHSGKLDELLTLLEYGLQRTPNSEEAMLWRGWMYYRQGKINDAIESFQQALAENPTYQDAQYALEFVSTR